MLGGDSSSSWSSDFLKGHPALHGPDNPLATREVGGARYDSKWAEEYLGEEIPVLKQQQHDTALSDIANEILGE